MKDVTMCECGHPKYVHSRHKSGKYSGGCPKCECTRSRGQS